MSYNSIADNTGYLLLAVIASETRIRQMSETLVAQFQ